jgi:hypothetical protein
VARYRAGDWGGAVTALAKAGELHGDDCTDWFFLAMSRCRLGEESAARREYEHAVEWLSKQSAPHEELLRFSAEAAKLIPKEKGDGRKPSQKSQTRTEKRDSGV